MAATSGMMVRVMMAKATSRAQVVGTHYRCVPPEKEPINHHGRRRNLMAGADAVTAGERHG
jgi:hypothetical protein